MLTRYIVTRSVAKELSNVMVTNLVDGHRMICAKDGLHILPNMESQSAMIWRTWIPTRKKEENEQW